MANLLDRPTTVRIGEELELSKLAPFLRSHFPNEPGPLASGNFPAAILISLMRFNLGTGNWSFAARPLAARSSQRTT